jgi:hypothetical protein
MHRNREDVMICILRSRLVQIPEPEKPEEGTESAMERDASMIVDRGF